VTLSATKSAITLDTVVSVSPNQVSAVLDGEIVVLNHQSGMYYGLNDVGSDIMDFIQSPQPVHKVRDRIFEQYEVDYEQCGQDVVALLTDMVDKGLVEISG
jgi:hypothetical protein